MSQARARLGARYVTNLVSMTARQDGYRAAAAVGAQAIAAEVRKLPRLARLALSKRDGTKVDHPVGYSEKILQAVARLPVEVRPYPIDPNQFHVHARSFAYPKAYAAGPLEEGGNRENKLLEYFVSLEILEIGAQDVVIDVASERSIFPSVVRQACGARVYRQDLIFPPESKVTASAGPRRKCRSPTSSRTSSCSTTPSSTSRGLQTRHSSRRRGVCSGRVASS